MQVVVHYSEIGLKGRNRPSFEERLRRNLERALAPLGGRVSRLYGRLLVELGDSVDWTEAEARLRRVFGVAFFGRATACAPELPEIERAVDRLVDGCTFESFGVRARRVDKQHPLSSRELNERLGARVVQRTGKRVDLDSPDLWIEVHLLSRQAIVLHERIPGPGGMPVGSAGRVVSLISGGIDSPVASWLMLKRGAEAIYVHFHSAPYTSSASQDKVRDLVALLGRWQGPATLWLVPFGELQRQLAAETPADPRIVLYRRFMLRAAEAIAERERALALVTGESLGQVSSQTLANLDTINRAAKLPVLRPLVGLDKAEIVALAQRIGSFPISIEPDDDCCSFLMPRSPATWTRPQPIEAIERGLDAKGMIDAVLDRATRERIEPIP
ncbi:MAG TPA: tRNA uracil 4-sulfurtransferase ThiI [Myxococcota bacterium]|nr:tRNA uracil 4-sulfurtransferase ThiI [Myxococcota bacterium]